MPHGERAARKQNKRREYWKARPGNHPNGQTNNSYSKTHTHRLERRAAKKETRE